MLQVNLRLSNSVPVKGGDVTERMSASPIQSVFSGGAECVLVSFPLASSRALKVPGRVASL